MDFPQSRGIASRSRTGGRIYPHIVGVGTPADLITDMFMGLQLCTPTTSELLCLVFHFFIALNLFGYMHTSPLCLTEETYPFLYHKCDLYIQIFLGTLLEVVALAVDNL